MARDQSLDTFASTYEGANFIATPPLYSSSRLFISLCAPVIFTSDTLHAHAHTQLTYTKREKEREREREIVTRGWILDFSARVSARAPSKSHRASALSPRVTASGLLFRPFSAVRPIVPRQELFIDEGWPNTIYVGLHGTGARVHATTPSIVRRARVRFLRIELRTCRDSRVFFSCRDVSIFDKPCAILLDEGGTKNPWD